MIAPSDLSALLPGFLPRQRWSGARDRRIETISLVGLDTLRGGWPALIQAVVEAIFSGGEMARYHLLIGLRPRDQPTGFLHGSEHTALGDVATEQGPAFAYDALLDPELGLYLLELVAPSEAADRVRHVGAEQSNTSLVYDDRLILKVFRRLAEGPNPDVEISEALFSTGFSGIPEPVARWRRGPYDLAFCQRFLPGGSEGWSLALSSLRDLYASRCEPGTAGGDFAAEAERLGQTTAELHLALAEAFGASPGDDASWARDIARQATAVLSGATADAAVSLIERLSKVADPGPSLRVHGDYHLGQVMRTDSGWYTLDFEGEPARPIAERRRPTSPQKDVAAMLRSLHYASEVAMAEWGEDVAHLARAWEARNRAAFLAGYHDRAVEGAILPADEESFRTVLRVFELDKAVYEIAYERAYRPGWAHIPESALRRILEAHP